MLTGSSRNHRSELGPEPEGAVTGPSGPLRVPPGTVTGTVWGTGTAASTAASAWGLTLPPLRAVTPGRLATRTPAALASQYSGRPGSTRSRIEGAAIRGGEVTAARGPCTLPCSCAAAHRQGRTAAVVVGEKGHWHTQPRRMLIDLPSY